MRVAVIGAGAAGLCTACHLKDASFVKKLVVFEQTKNVGGTWVYTERTGTDEYGLPIHSSMYKNMHTNFPLEIMQFQNFSFASYLKDEPASYAGHAKVFAYLKDYAKHFDLHKYIREKFGFRWVADCSPLAQFETLVSRVHLDTATSIWTVTSRDLVKNETQTDEFDAVIVCNGHYAAPKPADSTPYKAITLHSHDYRHPEAYSGKLAACLGAGPSGMDIAIELSAVCPKVYLCHNFPKMAGCFGVNVEQRAGFKAYTEEHIELNDGSTIKPEVIIYCTGYEMQFPFFDDSVHVTVGDEYTEDLYQHVVHTEHPHLYFVGIPKYIVPFPLFDVQVRFIERMLAGSLTMPRSQMRDWVKENYRTKVVEAKSSPKHAHFLGGAEWVHYCYELAKIAGFDAGIPPVVERMSVYVNRLRFSKPVYYKFNRFKVLNDQDFAIKNEDGKFELVDPEKFDASIVVYSC